MFIKKLSAKNFRNLSIEEVCFSPGLNILYGKNAQGKTNIVEAMYFGAFGRALRGKYDTEVIKHNETEAFIFYETVRDKQIHVTDVRLKKHGKKLEKVFLFEKFPVKHMRDLFGKLLVVLFGPEDLRLIKSGPGVRRRFMDMEICQLSPVYYNHIKEYHKTLKHRNALLKRLQKSKSEMDTLSAWDEQLVYYATRLSRTRAAFVEKVNEMAGTIYKSISGGEELSLVYKQGDVSIDLLKKNVEKDIFRGSTGEGIHTDEIEFEISGMNAKNFASQGQQRSAALSAKLAEVTIIKEATGESPILLLDDVLSELDSSRQEFLFDFLKGQQTFITATGTAGLKDIKEACVFYVENGRLVR